MHVLNACTKKYEQMPYIQKQHYDAIVTETRRVILPVNQHAGSRRDEVLCKPPLRDCS